MSGVLGRERDVAELTAGLDDAAASRGRFFLVAGEAGIGKTALTRHMMEVATARGFASLCARGWGGEGAPAYWPFIQIFRALLRDQGAAARENGRERAFLSPDRIAKIGQIVPEILEGPAAANATSTTTTTTATDAAKRFALFDAASGFLCDVATKQPLLLVFDDLQSVDPSTLSMLHFLARELRAARVMVIGAYREREAHGLEVEAELAKLVREGAMVKLGRLEKDAVQKFVEASKGMVAPVIADLIFRTSEGVPLFIEEVLRTMSTPGAAWLTGAPLPVGVRSVIRDRLARLDEGTHKVLEAASVIGRTFTLGLVSLLSPDVDAHDFVERAVLADVVERSAPGRYVFSHALTREALYREIPGALRAKLHAALIDAFEQNKAESTLSQRAYHALRAAPVIGVRRAVTYAREAADDAMKVQAFEDAADLLRRALAVLDIAPAEDAMRADVIAALERASTEVERPAPPTTAVAAAPISNSVPLPLPTSSARIGVPQTLSLSCQGDLWTASLGSATVRLKDSRGLQMLEQLVMRPGEEIHAITLSTASAQAEASPGSGPGAGSAVSGIIAGDAGEVLDREAILAYRERLSEVEEELREAEGWNDAARVDRSRSEIEFLRAELSRAVGLGGRTRRASADTERARVNCQRRIRDAIRRIAEQDATIGRHLLRAVRTGTFCAYLPNEAH